MNSANTSVISLLTPKLDPLFPVYTSEIVHNQILFHFGNRATFIILCRFSILSAFGYWLLFHHYDKQKAQVPGLAPYKPKKP